MSAPSSGHPGLRKRRLGIDSLRQIIIPADPSGIEFQIRGHGVSMSPFIRSGDRITIEPLGRKPLGTGDVVAFTAGIPEHLIIHRIVSRSAKGWVTKGDNSLRADETITDTNIIGRVTSIRRNGRFRRFGQGPERKLIAWLSRKGFLRRMTGRAAHLKRQMLGQWEGR